MQSKSICKTINKANLTPCARDEQSNDALSVCPWTDAKKSVCLIVHSSGIISCGPHQATHLIASPSWSTDLVATGGTMQSINGVTESHLILFLNLRKSLLSLPQSICLGVGTNNGPLLSRLIVTK